MDTKQLKRKHPAPYNCGQVEDSMSLYVDSELSSSQIERFETHLNGCAKCRELVDDCQGIVGAARQLADQEIPSGVSARLRLRIENEIHNNFSQTKPRLYLVK